jgi:hypothetical protein
MFHDWDEKPLEYLATANDNLFNSPKNHKEIKLPEFLRVTYWP